MIDNLYSLLSLSNWSNYSLENTSQDEHLKVLGIDFDQTLVRANDIYLGSEDHEKWLQDERRNGKIDRHTKWFIKVRDKVPYQSCEAFEKINNLIQEFRLNGWQVVILTARTLEMKEITLKHIKQTGLLFTEKELIMRNESGKGIEKSDSLKDWLEKCQNWHKTRHFTLIFADDSLYNIKEMLKNLYKKIPEKKVTMACYHYQAHLPSSIVKTDQLANLTLQLAAYKSDLTIPQNQNNIDKRDLEIAMKTLEIDNIDQQSLLKVMLNIASKDCCPFHLNTF